MGAIVLVDTDVLIDMMIGRREVLDKPMGITTVTFYEFLRGAKSVDDAAKLLEDSFQIFPETPESVKISAKIWQDLRASGMQTPDADIIIAGIAIANNIPLLTRNRKHFERFQKYGLQLYEERQ